MRSFTDRPVDDATVAAVLDTARFAPSGGNRQPWKVAVVKDPAIRQSMDYGEAIVKEFSDAQLNERVAPPPFMGTQASRIRLIYGSMQHTQDIYGQMVVYVRLNGIVPPASRRGGL